MNENWYIWYEIYEDGVLINHSKSRYHRAYKHKSSAERRARQLWGKELTDQNGSIYTHKWIISKTCLWEDVYIFETRAEAENLLFYMRLIMDRYEVVTRSDVKNFLGMETNWLDTREGWLTNDFKSVRPILRGSKLYVVELPTAKVID